MALDATQMNLASAKATAELGVWLQPGLGNAYPELKAILSKLFRDRVASLNFVPNDWLGRVLALYDLDPTVLVKLIPSKGPNGNTLAQAPDWIKASSARVDAWQEIVNAQDKAVVSYARGQQEAGKAELDRLYANAEFWNNGFGATLISTAESIRDLPGNVAGAIGDGALSVLKSFLVRTWYLWAMAGIGALVWFNRAALFKKAGKKVGEML